MHTRPHYQNKESHNDRPLSRSRCMFRTAPSCLFVWFSLWKQVAVTPTSSPALSLKAAEKEKLPSPTSSTSRVLDIFKEISNNSASSHVSRRTNIYHTFDRGLHRPFDYRAWTEHRKPDRTPCGINIGPHVTMTPNDALTSGELEI